MDEKDLKLLYMLKRDARVSLTKISKELSMSVPAVTYRLNKLVESGTIRNFTINIDEQILTPNNISYLIRGRIPENSDNVFQNLKKSGLFDNLGKLAAHLNFFGITRSLTSENLNSILSVIEGNHIVDYVVSTITKKEDGSFDGDVVAETVSSIYCPLCQKKFDGEGIVTTIGAQIMGFCCQNCKEEFLEKYEKITKDS